MQRLSGAQRVLMEAFDPDVWTDEERHVRVVSAIGAVTVTMMANRESRWTERTDVVIAAGLGALGHGNNGDVGTGD